MWVKYVRTLDVQLGKNIDWWRWSVLFFYMFFLFWLTGRTNGNLFDLMRRIIGWGCPSVFTFFASSGICTRDFCSTVQSSLRIINLAKRARCLSRQKPSLVFCVYYPRLVAHHRDLVDQGSAPAVRLWRSHSVPRTFSRLYTIDSIQRTIVQKTSTSLA